MSWRFLYILTIFFCVAGLMAAEQPKKGTLPHVVLNKEQSWKAIEQAVRQRLQNCLLGATHRQKLACSDSYTCEVIRNGGLARVSPAYYFGPKLGP